jgi:PKD repeat protein
MALAGMLATAVLVQNAAALPPTVNSFTITPSPPVFGEPATLSVDVTWGGAPGEVTWNFGDGTGLATTSTTSVGHTYNVFGTRTLNIQATNGETPAETSVAALTPTLRVNRRPVAAFDFNPVSPFVGGDVLFASNSFDPDGDAVLHLWNFGDGATSPSAGPSHPFASSGAHNVSLTVVDEFGAASATASREILVQGLPAAANAPPLASFALSPRHPRVGQQVEFVSSATDPEGALRDQRWDLDGDGQFDDGQGDRVLETYSTPGSKTIRLRVLDAGGAAAVAERVLTVSPGPTARAGLLSPFPVVRINGEAHAFGTLVRILSVRAPRATLVSVRCTGEGCPAKQRRRRVGKSRVVRFPAFERTLSVGVRLEVFARKPDKIGKYTSFRIRRNLAPKRVDRCLVPGSSRPVRCGSRETRAPIPSP